MNRRGFLKTTAASALAAGCSTAGERPNVVLIVTSHQHADTLRWMPSLTGLAGRGVSFENAYCASPESGPSRAATLTGRMPSETGVIEDGGAIRSGIPNLGEWLQTEAGYATYYAGQWDLPRPYQEPLPGFEALPGGIAGQGSLSDPPISRACESFLSHQRGSEPFLLVVGLHQPGDIAEWLRLNAADPGRLPYPEIRDELPPLPENFDHESIEPRFLQELRQSREPAMGNWSDERWRYYLWSYRRYIEMMDGELGRILDALDNPGRGRDTAVIFASDHGEGLGSHHMVRAGTSYEESLRIPLVVAWPGRIDAGEMDTTTLASAADVVPTLAEMIGIDPPAGVVGNSVLSANAGAAAAEDRYIVCEIPPNIGRVVRTRRYKYVTYAGDTVDQLFDVLEDLGETWNLASDAGLASVLEEHKALLRDWEARLEPAPGLPNESAWWRV